MNKFVFKIVMLVGTLLMFIGLLSNIWSLEIKMGDYKPFAEINIFENFDTTIFCGNFESFDSSLLTISKYIVIVLISASALSTILVFITFAMKEKSKRILNYFILLFSILVSICVISLFIIDILFIKQNTFVQDNGFTLKPVMETGMYFTIMGGFSTGLFGMYMFFTK